MPELWAHCNTKSRVILAYLYYQETGHYPDWYLILKGEKLAPKESAVTMSRGIEEERLEELQRLMRRPPSRSRE